MSIKGSRDRTTDKPAYDASPLWGHIDAKKIKATRIFNDNKHLIDGSNVKIVCKQCEHNAYNGDGVCGACENEDKTKGNEND